MDYFKGLTNWLAEMVFPARCLNCDQVGHDLCPICLARIEPRTHQDCIVCHQLAPAGVPCPNCRPKTQVDRLLVAAQSHDELMNRAVYALKYRFITGLAAPLATWLVSVLDPRPLALNSPPLITAVPLHPRRRRERGFNQADLLAQKIAADLTLEYRPDLLERRRATASQVQTLSRQQRLENMKDAFRVRGPESSESREIILIDDVCTTGATLDACATALKSAGATSVTALVLIRG